MTALNSPDLYFVAIAPREIEFIEESTGKDVVDLKGSSFDSEFAICNPNEYLEYVSSQSCVSLRKLSKDYHFSK